MQEAKRLMEAFYGATKDFLSYGSTRYIASNVDTFSKELQKWKSILIEISPIVKDMGPTDISAFVNEFRGEILYTYQVIIGKQAELFFGKRVIAAIRNAYDQFTGLLKMKKTPTEYYQRIATRIFSKFCEGVLFNPSNLENDPAYVGPGPEYHRRESCGSKMLNIDEKLGPKMTNSANIVSTKQTRARNCLIERLFYDAIYKAAFYEQNLGHGVELVRTRRLYDHYFPNEIIYIDVMFTRIIYPVSLTVRTLNKVTGREHREVYKRTLISASHISYGPLTYSSRTI